MYVQYISVDYCNDLKRLRVARWQKVILTVLVRIDYEKFSYPMKSLRSWRREGAPTYNANPIKFFLENLLFGVARNEQAWHYL